MNFKGNRKRFYGYVRNLQTRPVAVTQLLKENGNLTDTDRETATVLGEYFNEVYTKETTYNDLATDNNTSEESQHRCIGSEIKLDPESVKKILLRLKPDKSSGPDDMHPLVLKECAEYVSMPLSLIFKKSLISRQVPGVWKLANITPI
jgi:hypothetical protein